jgi:S-DNA-T family DNA segregation ATPase FtsK/SpoIIIE
MYYIIFILLGYVSTLLFINSLFYVSSNLPLANFFPYCTFFYVAMLSCYLFLAYLKREKNYFLVISILAVGPVIFFTSNGSLSTDINKVKLLNFLQLCGVITCGYLLFRCFKNIPSASFALNFLPAINNKQVSSIKLAPDTASVIRDSASNILPRQLPKEKPESRPNSVSFNGNIIELESNSPEITSNTPYTMSESPSLIHNILLKSEHGQNVESVPSLEYFSTVSRKIIAKLEEFAILSSVVDVLKGPVVDTFELELGAGVKMSKVLGLVEDLSLALAGSPVRIVFPMPGRSTLGIEVPRSPRQLIRLESLLLEEESISDKYKLPLVLGRDAFGKLAVEDLAKAPHVLVAGATGAGKSVFINCLLVSLITKVDLNDFKLILIDPKQLELAVYSKLSNLLMPVITNHSIANAALLWACDEMEKRYELLSGYGVRNIDSFNVKFPEKKMPYIVILIDEFADLILTKSGKDIEVNICRLAAKARACGIHLVLATQRPSVDVITGLIKANFPTRISFRVTSSMDSRTILNSGGAEKLLGMGDMLFKSGIDLRRMHSAYISDEQIESIVSVCSVDNPQFSEDLDKYIDSFGQKDDATGTISQNGEVGGDELYSKALELVLEYKSASASMLQRRLKVGYNRAANLIEQLERQGVVSPQDGSKPRKVMI